MSDGGKLDPSEFDATRKPLAEASTLPPWCYTSAEFFDLEQRHIFAPAWRLVGRVDELEDEGAFRTISTVRGPVVVTRARDGILRGFANSCRHRGAQLVTGAGQCRALVCPYHSWTFGLDGTLRAAPGMSGIDGFDTSDFPLVPVRLEQWGGFVFVNTDPEAPPLSAALGDMVSRFAGHRPEAMRCVRRVSFTIGANWKLLAENALEAYHTGSVHAATVGAQVSEQVETSGGWTALRVVDERSVGTLPGVPPPFPPIADLPAREAKATTFTMFYPSTQFVFAPDCMWWLDFQPVSASETVLELGSCFPEGTVALPDFESDVRSYYDRWDRATPEDNTICEAQQHGLTFADRAPGRFATSEFAVHALDNWVLDQVTG